MSTPVNKQDWRTQPHVVEVIAVESMSYDQSLIRDQHRVTTTHSFANQILWLLTASFLVLPIWQVLLLLTPLLASLISLEVESHVR